MKTFFQHFIRHSICICLSFAIASTPAFAAGPLTMVVPFSKQVDMQPDTIFCVKGSTENPASYCTDSTPCKTMDGATGTPHPVCLAGTINPPAGAMILASSCWNLQTDYTCMQYVSDCSTYTDNSKCVEVGKGTCVTPTPVSDCSIYPPDSTCVEVVVTDVNSPPLTLAPLAAKRTGTCLSTIRKFSCTDIAAVTHPPSSGCNTTTSQDGLDWSTHSDSAANDFIAVTTSAEIARQLALYSDKTDGMMKGLFPGVALGCRNKYSGLNNCCSETPSGTFTNRQSALVQQIAISGFKVGAGYAMQYGSAYVEDFVIEKAAGTFAEAGSIAMFDSIGSTAAGWESFTGTFGVYGFGFTAEGAASGLASTTGITTAADSFQIGTSGVYFNPYALAAAIIIQVIIKMMECNQDEKDLANERKDDLCQYVGAYCSNNTWVGCLETTTSYCCYNGLLGKAIEVGAHKQLGLSWGSGESPSCGGLTVEQMSSLDFTKPEMVDALKPFQDLIMANHKASVAPMLTNGTVKSNIQSKNSTTSHILCLQRQKFDASTVCN